MSSQPNQDSASDKAKSASKRDRLPFEPGSTKKKTPKKSAPASASASSQAAPVARKNAIPEVVSRRMARRMAAFCGVPTFLGMMTFVVSYFIVRNQIYKLPNSAVLLVSLGFFGLGVLGLSYGVFSASWDETREGGWLGLEEFKLNFSRTIASWKEARAQARAQQSGGNEG